ncbi:alpha/beta hydrolase [Solirubrobacter phytolaccae]|uniref:Alpha/beta hydrolase n=1 Tax=Solirubrobacter phytolaccae TaxID=1404360 RepID=A0A9X3S9V8_9ACTN|nr:alpha/beta hydrolase [Solirubrobacter phytolaccae]MDA0183814.1 alpha/beta hydrolase [Solirubrobacter phytolaccae]
MRPTVVLVHGAFAESSSWNGVLARLSEAGLPAVAFANPLRSVAADAEALSDRLRTIDGPVVLVGHSYGGMVITNVDQSAAEIVAAVYVCAFAPDLGESANELAAKFPGSTLAEALEPVARGDAGETDLYITKARFHSQFCADVNGDTAARMYETQRPITLEALQEPSSDERCLWKDVPTYSVVGAEDRNIPAETQRFMAGRAGARRTLELADGSHAVAVAQPGPIVEVVLEAAAAPVAS